VSAHFCASTLASKSNRQSQIRLRHQCGREVICNMNTTLSTGCPTSTAMTITPSIETYKAGDVLTCGSDGYQPTYTWSGMAAIGTTNQVNVDSPNPYTLPAGPFSLTCTADVSQLDCTATTTVTETAYSKYRQQHNTLVTVVILVPSLMYANWHVVAASTACFDNIHLA